LCRQFAIHTADRSGGPRCLAVSAQNALAHLLHFAKQSGSNLVIPHKAMPSGAKS
jgi:hypothetical protein